MGCRAAKVLQIVMRYLMRVGPQRSELHSALSGLKGEGIHFERIEEILSTLPAGKEVVDGGEQRIPSEFYGVALPFKADGLGEVQAMLPGLTRQQVRTAH